MAFLVPLTLIVLALALAGTWFVLWQLVRQQGRMMLRIDALEALLDSQTREPAAASNGHAGPDRDASGRGGRRQLPTERPLSESRILRSGLAPGTPAPGFDLPAVSGGTTSLAGFRGRGVLLVFSDPACGPCQSLLPQLAELPTASTTGSLQVVLVSRGDAHQNQPLIDAHGIRFP